MHSCDNPACVKLQHLEPATQAANLADMNNKGRRRGPHTKTGANQDG